MELYVSIAIGIMLGELGKELIYRIQNALWSLKKHDKLKAGLYKWDDTDELLEKQKKNPTPCVNTGEWGLLVSTGLLGPLKGYSSEPIPY